MALEASARDTARLGPVGESESQLIHIFDAARNMIDAPARRRSAKSALPYREFLDALGVAVYTTDAAGRITFFNEAEIGRASCRERVRECGGGASEQRK